jgi:hypothetical protein
MDPAKKIAQGVIHGEPLQLFSDVHALVVNTTGANMRLRRAIVTSWVLLLFPFVCALADRPAPPRDYMVVTEDERHVFVMLAPGNARNDDLSDISKLYSESGLYRNDESNTPLWTVDWYGDAEPASNGVNLIRWGPWAETTDQLAVSFYDHGEELNHYHIRELIVDESKLQRSVSHFSWIADRHYDDEQGILELRTVDGQKYRFSVKTGRILGLATAE